MPAEDRSGEMGLRMPAPEKNSPLDVIPIPVAIAAWAGTVTGATYCCSICICIGKGGVDETGGGSLAGGSVYW